MKQRGKKSAAELSVVTPLPSVRRQRVPPDLTEQEAHIWQQVVGDMPADWFRPSNTPLLVQYCRHTANANRISQLVENAAGADPFEADEYAAMLKLQERESRMIASLATKMRVSQQSQYHDRTAARAVDNQPTQKAPWEE